MYTYIYIYNLYVCTSYIYIYIYIYIHFRVLGIILASILAIQKQKKYSVAG